MSLSLDANIVWRIISEANANQEKHTYFKCLPLYAEARILKQWWFFINYIRYLLKLLF